MRTVEGKWVRIRILKHIISIYGSYFPNAIATVPEHIAKNWIQGGIAESEVSKPAVIPKGKFWCGKCQSLHILKSLKGRTHQKYEVKNEGEALEEGFHREQTVSSW